MVNIINNLITQLNCSCIVKSGVGMRFQLEKISLKLCHTIYLINNKNKKL